MSSEKIESIVNSWISFFELSKTDPARDKYWAQVEEVMEWNTQDPESLWQFIQQVYRRRPSEEVLANLAAGPLEDLLVYHGKSYIERVILLARTDENFNSILGGVWKNSIDDDVWNMILSLRQ